MSRNLKLLPWLIAAVAIAFTVLRAEPTRVEAQDAPGGDMAEMMKKWQEYMTPGEPHAEMAKMVGEWDFVITQYIPGMPPTKAEGKSVLSLQMGGRWLRDETTSTVMGQPFHGLGFTGYDNAIGKHVFTWMDNMSTGMIAGVGDYDDETKTCTYTTHSSDPMTGKTKYGRTTITWKSDDAYEMKAYASGPDGNEMLEMEIAYERKSESASKPK